MKNYSIRACQIFCILFLAALLGACTRSENSTAGAAPAAAAVAPAVSEDWKPVKNITLVIGHAPGGGMDIMCRLLIPIMQQELGVTIVPQQMPGSNSAVSAEYIMREPADGYTLWGFSSGAVTFPVTGVSDLYYKDIQMLAIVQSSNPVISVAVDSPIKTMEQFIELIKSGKSTASNSGIGGAWHVPQMMIVNAIGGSVSYVPFDGGKGAITAAAQKEVDWAISDISEAKTFIIDKLVRPLCIYKTTDMEIEGYGPIPSILKWLPQLEGIIPSTNSFRGIGIKRGAPQNVIDTYLKVIKKAATSEEFINASRKLSLDPIAIIGKEAEDLTEDATKFASWTLFDLGLGDRNPADIGLSR
jgi:tripartite-type tricarboxylate transporter receptor subunit TctC